MLGKKMPSICALLGHRWRVIALSERHDRMHDVHPLAGALATCGRCRCWWDDLPGNRPNRGPRARRLT